MIGRLEKTVIDCPAPTLAGFYCQVLGMRVNEDIDGWMVIAQSPAPVSWLSSGPSNGFRRAGLSRRTQQLHLDIRVSDADWAEQRLLALGATRVPSEHEMGFWVLTDPVGHPFCIVFGRRSTG
jgi:hypothetical protein